MLVNVNGQVCELVKAEAKGGSYHRRVPRKGGKGYTYYYDEDKYAASKNAHLDGPATRSARLTKAVLGAVEGAGKSGCAIKSLRDMAKKVKGCLEKGDLSYKKGMLYRKAMKKAKLEIAAEPKKKDVDKPEEEPEKKEAAKKEDAKGDKEQQEKGQKKPLKKSDVRLYLHDPLYKAKGPIGRGKRGGKIYGYDSKGKPIYKPSEAPSKGAKKKPSKPEAQLSLFGQPKLEKPEPKVQEVVQPQASKVIEPATETAHVEGQKPKTIEPAAGPTMRQAKQQPIKDAPVGSEFTIVRAGGVLTLGFKKVSADEVILISKNDQPVDPKIGGNRRGLGRVLALIDYEQDVITVETPDQTVQEVQEQRKGAQTLAQKMTRVQKLIESEYPGVSQDKLDDLYRKLVDAQAGRPGSNIDAAIAEAEGLLGGLPIDAVVQPQAPKVIEPAAEATSEPKMMTAAEMKEYARQATENQEIERQQRLAKEKERAEWAAAERLKTPEQREAELEAYRDRWRAVPRSGKGWKLLAKPLPEVRLKKDNDDLLKKLEAAPLGSTIRMTNIDGESTDYLKTSTKVVKMVAASDREVPEAAKEISIPMDMILPAGLFANVQAELKAPPKGKEPKPEVQPVEEPPQEGESGLPEIPPKPAAPERIPREGFKAEMRRRYDLGLTPQGNTYAVKDAIKEIGGIWDRLKKRWLLPSQEAVDYVEAVLAHKAVEQSKTATKAASEGLTVSGRTWDERDTLKRAGGKWDGGTKQWVMPDKETAALLQELINIGGPSYPSPKMVERATALLKGMTTREWDYVGPGPTYGRIGWDTPEIGLKNLDNMNAGGVVDLIIDLKAAKKEAKGADPVTGADKVTEHQVHIAKTLGEQLRAYSDEKQPTIDQLRGYSRDEILDLTKRLRENLAWYRNPKTRAHIF
jgi:hypothetical protein